VGKELSIAGKDWLTEEEAAHYCGVSVPQLRNHYHELGISPRRFLGRKLYSKAELYDAIVNSERWHPEPARGVPYGASSPEAVAARMIAELRGTGTRQSRRPNLSPTPARPYRPSKKP